MNQQLSGQNGEKQGEQFEDSESRVVKSRANLRPAKYSLQKRIEDMKHRVEYRRMIDFPDREAVFHLRREAYANRMGVAKEWAAEKVDDAYEPNSATIGLFIDKKLVGSFKVTVATAEYPESQSGKAFPDEVNRELALGKMFIDPGRFVADQKATLEFPELPYLLMKVPVMACQYFDADECFSLIRKEHHTFYRRVFNAEILAGPAWCEPLNFDWVLMTSKVHQVRDSVFKRFPFWKASFLEMRQLFGAVEAMPAIVEHRKKAA